MAVDDIDLSALEFWAQPDEARDEAFTRLRREAPVKHFEELRIDDTEGAANGGFPPGPGYWALTRYADVWHVSRHPDLFQSGQGVNIPDMPTEIAEFFGSMISMDDPSHARLRRIVSGTFTPKMLNRVLDDVADTARAVVGQVRG